MSNLLSHTIKAILLFVGLIPLGLSAQAPTSDDSFWDQFTEEQLNLYLGDFDETTLLNEYCDWLYSFHRGYTGQHMTALEQFEAILDRPTEEDTQINWGQIISQSATDAANEILGGVKIFGQGVPVGMRQIAGQTVAVVKLPGLNTLYSFIDRAHRESARAAASSAQRTVRSYIINLRSEMSDRLNQITARSFYDVMMTDLEGYSQRDRLAEYCQMKISLEVDAGPLVPSSRKVEYQTYVEFLNSFYESTEDQRRRGGYIQVELNMGSVREIRTITQLLTTIIIVEGFDEPEYYEWQLRTPESVTFKIVGLPGIGDKIEERLLELDRHSDFYDGILDLPVYKSIRCKLYNRPDTNHEDYDGSFLVIGEYSYPLICGLSKSNRILNPNSHHPHRHLLQLARSIIENKSSYVRFRSGLDFI